jgi:hypothetical protein
MGCGWVWRDAGHPRSTPYIRDECTMRKTEAKAPAADPDPDTLEGTDWIEWVLAH